MNQQLNITYYIPHQWTLPFLKLHLMIGLLFFPENVVRFYTEAIAVIRLSAAGFLCLKNDF